MNPKQKRLQEAQEDMLSFFITVAIEPFGVYDGSDTIRYVYNTEQLWFIKNTYKTHCNEPVNSSNNHNNKHNQGVATAWTATSS